MVICSASWLAQEGRLLLFNIQDQKPREALYIEKACLASQKPNLDVRLLSEEVDHTLRDCQSKPKSSRWYLLKLLKL
jgi:hypothetical protein